MTRTDAGPQCNTCRWWAPAANGASFGTCHARPPALVAAPDRVVGVITRWPATNFDSGCGEWTNQRPERDQAPWQRLHGRYKGATGEEGES